MNIDHGVAIIAIEAVAGVVSTIIFAFGIKVAVDRFVKSVKEINGPPPKTLAELRHERIRVSAVAIVAGHVSAPGNEDCSASALVVSAWDLAEALETHSDKILTAAKLQDGPLFAYGESEGWVGNTSGLPVPPKRA